MDGNSLSNTVELGSWSLSSQRLTEMNPDLVPSVDDSRRTAAFNNCCGHSPTISVNIAPTVAGIHVPFWTEETTERLIRERGIDVIRAVNSNGVPLLCDAILQRQLDSAKLLLEFASEHESFVLIDTGKCPPLDWAIKQGCVVVAKFVLDYLVERRLSVDESCSILTNYLFPLIKEFPILMKEYLQQDKFSFEYGRFSVPYSLFKERGNRPVAMTTDEPLVDWTQMDSATAKDFWIHKAEQYSSEMQKTTGLQVDVIAKFFCVNQHFVRPSALHDTVSINSMPDTTYGWNHVLRLLSKSNLPVEIFKSESLSTFANWVFYSLHNRFLCLLILDILTAGIFAFFAATYGLRTESPNGFERALPLLLIIATFLLPLVTVLICDSKIKQAILLSRKVEKRKPLCDVIEALLPFDKIGPFVSMAKYSFKAVIPFSGLGFSVLFGFTVAFRVLFNSKFYSDEDESEEQEDFSDFFHVLKLLFQASVFGNFDEEAFRSTDTFIGVWRSILFNGFIFVCGIVLISLLVAILGDTYSSVRFTENEELLKCRANMGGAAMFHISHRFVSSEERNRTQRDEGTEVTVSEKAKTRVNSWLPQLHLRDRDRQRYFHYLVLACKTGEEESLQSQWESKMLQFERTMQREMQQSFDKSKQQVCRVLSRISDLEDHLRQSQEMFSNANAKIYEFEERHKEMAHSLAQIVEKLNAANAAETE